MIHTIFLLRTPWDRLRQLFNEIYFFFTYLFLVELGLRCCTQTFSSCGELGLLSVVVSRPLIAVVSLVAERPAVGVRASVVAAQGLRSCGSQALVAPPHVESSQTRDQTHVPRIGLSTAPPGKSSFYF